MSRKILLLAVALLALLATSASAAPKQVVSTFGTAGTGNGELGSPVGGVAVNQGTGDVYVVDAGNDRVQRFGADGSYLGQFGTNGSGDGEFSFGGNRAGVAVDQSTGSVYVTDTSNNRVQRFSAAGTYEAQFGTAGAGDGEFASPIAVAVDPTSQDVFVADRDNNRVQRFSSTGVYETQFGTAGSGYGEIYSPSSVAVDSTGSVYVLDSGNGRVQKFTNNGGFTAVFAPATANVYPQVIAVDAVTDRVLVEQYLSDFSGMEILELTPAGNVVERHGSALPSPGGIDRRSSSSVIYSSDAYGSRVLALDDPAPVDLTVDATAITATSATLNGTINPHNGPGVTYHFETTTDFSTWTSTPNGGPVTGNSDSPVSADLTGLQPNTTYYYRLVATQPLNPTTTSGVQSFSTATAAPAVVTTGGTIDGGVATLKGTVDPQGLATTYWFEYGLTTSYGSRAPGEQNADASAGDGNAPVPVSWHVNGLEPGKTYHYRLVARNAQGTTNGNDITLTPAAPGGGIDTSRSFERVSPQDKGNTDVAGDSVNAATQVALDGNSLVYTSSGAYPGLVRSGALPFTYRATRTSTGWKNESLTPPSRATMANCSACSVGNTGQVIFVNRDLSRSVVATNVALAPGASDATNLYHQENPGSAFGLLSPGAPSAAAVANDTQNYLYPVAATQDLEHVVFSSAYPMAPGAIDQEDTSSVYDAKNLYVSSGGTVRLVSVDENGATITGQNVFVGNSYTCCIVSNTRQHGISEDGSRIFFGFQDGSYSRLYVRKDGVDTDLIPGGVEFLAANPAGSEALFRAADGSIKHYDVASGAVEDIPGEYFVGASESLDYVYFTRGADAVGDPSVVPPGSDGLYVRHGGVTRLIATVARKSESIPQDFRVPDWRAVGSVSSVSPDGKTLAFVTAGAVNGVDTNGGHPLYVYDAAADRLDCLSCPAQESPQSKTALYGAPNPMQNTTYAHALGNRNNVSADGKRVFFHTAASLVPQDSNGKIDVYVWENGATRLISDGKGKYDTRFLSASPSGDDVFVVTRNQLVKDDRDDYADVYDARVGGGFAPAPDAAPVCQGDACQGLPNGQPVAPSIGSVSFAGPGNEVSAPRGPAGKVKVSASKRTVRGSVFSVSVKVPGKGRITASGSGLRSVKRTASRAGTYRVKVQLTAKAKKTLRRKHQLKVTVRVGYTPTGGKASSATLSMTVKA